ncbi:glycoside hydrolase family 43 protein [Sphaerobolus stellatus SS14]|nr:glycoside hydrolase family 43 protein [Sphaerobolus stellatus SS14]
MKNLGESVIAFLLTLPLLSLSQTTWPAPQNVTGSTDVHDPSICKDNKGKYWLFTTSVGLEIKTSEDRKNWTLIGTVWAPEQDIWTNNFTLTSDGNIWAPDCHFINGEFWLYYAASSFGSQNSGVFLAKSKSGLPGTWRNEGLVTSTTPSDNYNAIDPNLFIGMVSRHKLTSKVVDYTYSTSIDQRGKWHLTLGSFWTGIKQFSLLANSGKLETPTVAALAERTVNSGAIEAGYLFQVKDFYYLFTSWDFCCQGVNSTYNIRVVRSRSVDGPFVDKDGVQALDGGGTLVLGTHDNIVGPGGQSLFWDKGEPILVYQNLTPSIDYYTPAGSFIASELLESDETRLTNGKQLNVKHYGSIDKHDQTATTSTQFSREGHTSVRTRTVSGLNSHCSL